MKVLHIIIGLNIGGAEIMLKRLIESQTSKFKIHHIVVSLTDKGVLGDLLIEQGITVHKLGMSSIFKVPSVFLKLRRVLQMTQPDLVHTWMYHSDLMGGLACYSLGFRNLVWSIRSTDIHKGGSKVTLLIRKLCASLSRQLPSVIVCAADVSRRVHETVGYVSDKMQVIPNGFELDKFFPTGLNRCGIRSELGVGSDCMLVISVGRYNPVKDHKTFIQAAGKVAALHDHVRFLLVGRDLEQSNQQLMALIEATGRADAFYLLGERKDIPACLQAGDVFCLHSLTEGFPNVLGEAMAVGLPCISTDVGDAPYLLDNPEWVVPAASPEKLADKLDAMLSLPAVEREVLGQVSVSRISEHFTMDKISRRYYDLYTSVIGSK